MGFSKVVYLYCDGQTDVCECDGYEASSGDSGYEKIADYKASMKSVGWHFKSNKAYCPACWKEIKENRENGKRA